jgi:hypothetical protein
VGSLFLCRVGSLLEGVRLALELFDKPVADHGGTGEDAERESEDHRDDRHEVIPPTDHTTFLNQSRNAWKFCET